MSWPLTPSLILPPYQPAAKPAAPTPKQESGQAQTAGKTHLAGHRRQARQGEARLTRPYGWFRRHEISHTRQAQTEHESWREEHERRSDENRESRFMRHGRHLRPRHEAPSSRSGGALSYDYHSSSRSYHLGGY